MAPRLVQFVQFNHPRRPYNWASNFFSGGPMSTLITNSGAMDGWSRSHDDVGTAVKGVADEADRDPNLFDSHGAISQPILAAQNATDAARNDAVGATHTA